MEKHFITKNLVGLSFYFAWCLIQAYSNLVNAYEVLLTFDFSIRNTDPRFHLVL